MKKKYLFGFLLFVAFSFGRVSTKHAHQVAPSNTSYGGDKIFMNAEQDSEDSLKWKRRHKKRKKSRRPQRGR